jgi:hypothetical protein
MPKGKDETQERKIREKEFNLNEGGKKAIQYWK